MTSPFSDPLVVGIVSSLGSIVLAMIGGWAKNQIERIGAVEDKSERASERQTDRTIDFTGDIAALNAKVALLMEDRRRCEELAERTARLEAFQAWAETLLEKAVAGLDKAVAFEARFEERLVTLFKGMGAITLRVERLLTPAAPAPQQLPN